MNWDKEVDILVVGSGNGALTAGICCHDMSKEANADGKADDILVIEKSDKFGGTSAISGGGVWVPNNRYAKAAGAQDSYEDAFTYLDNTIPKDQVKREMLETYLTNSPKMVDFLHSAAEFVTWFRRIPRLFQ